MLANNKTSDQITEELVDLVGDNYGEFEQKATSTHLFVLPSFLPS